MSNAWIGKIFRLLFFRTVAAKESSRLKCSSKIAFHKILKNEKKVCVGAYIY